MDAKLENLIHELEKHKERMTAKELASALNISLRSIHNYIDAINDTEPDTILSSRSGYALDPAKAKKLLASESSRIPQTSEERTVYLLRQLIRNSEGMNLYDLCDEIAVSASTLKADLGKIRRMIGKYDLELSTKNDNIQIIGTEKNKRHVLSTILYNESTGSFQSIDSIQEIFPNLDIHEIRRAVLEVFNKYQYYINDYSLMNLIWHITITIDRIQNGMTNDIDIPADVDTNSLDYRIASEIRDKLSETFHIEFSPSETYELMLLIVSRATNLDYRSITKENVEQFIGKDCYNLVNKLITNIASYYYIDLSEPEFFVRFALHIKNLIVRAKNDYFIRNPLTENIRRTCPLIYDNAVIAAATIKEETGITINDDEIAYIAFHLGSTIEDQKNLHNKINAILYSPNYYDSNLKLASRLSNEFPNDLLISNVLTDINDLDKQNNANLIISTFPAQFRTSIPVLIISPIISEKDVENLGRKISEIQKQRKQKVFSGYLHELMDPSLFFISNEKLTKGETIHRMAVLLQSHGIAADNFEGEVLEREKMSSTAFGAFALPHAMKMHSPKTRLCVLINHAGIEWDPAHKVHLVILMCFNKSERYIFNETFEPLTMILSDPATLNELIKANSFDKFIDTLTSAYTVS